MLTHRATHRWRTAGTVAISLGLILLIVAPASAATPTLTASLTPDSANAGAQTPFALNVSSDQGSLQTLTLEAPSNFNVDLASVVLSSGTLSGSSTPTMIVVGGLKISGSAVLSVSFDGYPACTPNPSYTWTLSGIQKGGTAYASQTFSTTVTQPSSCKLEFQPIADQLTGFPFTVKVDVVRENGSIDPTYTDQVSLSIETDPGTNESPSPLTSNSPRTPSGGTAEFSASLNVAGTGYVLEACSPTINNGPCAPVLEDGLGFLSGLFAVYDSKTDCENGRSCFASASVAQQVSTTVSANGQTGTSVKAGVFGVPDAIPGGPGNLSNLDCPGYDEITEVISSFDFDGSGIKTVVDVISAEQMKEIANQGVSFLQGCFGSSLPFTDRSGNDAVFDETLGLFVGLLPDCPANKKNLASFAPCVVSRQGGGQGTGLFTYVAADEDPGGKRN
jgi:hypothetical protein